MTVDLSPFLHTISTKIDKVTDDMVEIKITLARNTDSLEQHMRRTTALEALVEQNKKAVEPIKVDVASIFTVIYFTRWVMGCGAVTAAVVTIMKILL